MTNDKILPAAGNREKIRHLLLWLRPALPKHWLLILAGVMWTMVGVMLLGFAFTWLTNPFSTVSVVLGLLGVSLSVAANRFQFSALAKKNIQRIQSLDEKACLFSFQGGLKVP